MRALERGGPLWARILGVRVPVCAFPEHAISVCKASCLSPVGLFIYASDLFYRRFKGTYKDT